MLNIKNLFIVDTYPIRGKGIRLDEINNIIYFNKLTEPPPPESIFLFSEDITPNLESFKQLGRLYPWVLHNPARCDIGNKLETFDYIKSNGGLGNIKLPEHGPEVGEPYIVKKVRASKGGDIINGKTGVDEFKVQYVGKKVNGHHVQVRVRVKYNYISISDIQIRPSLKWNVHTKDQDASAVVKMYKYFWETVKVDWDDVLNNIISLFGCGYYAMDLVWDGVDLWFCEIGYKFKDKTYEKWIKVNNIWK